jgi:hypothetical protein
MKPNINSVEVHPQLSNNSHPSDGALVGIGSLWLERTIKSRAGNHGAIVRKAYFKWYGRPEGPGLS